MPYSSITGRYWEDPLDNLVGRTITKIHWTSEAVYFEVDGGEVLGYEVEGDCCSWSYFHDFFGVNHLLSNGPVVSVGEVNLDDNDPRFKVPGDKGTWDDCTQVYGYEMVTEHSLWGEVTSVLSFRNESNGYYGGSMERIKDPVIPEGALVLTDDYLGD